MNNKPKTLQLAYYERNVRGTLVHLFILFTWYGFLGDFWHFAQMLCDDALLNLSRMLKYRAQGADVFAALSVLKIHQVQVEQWLLIVAACTIAWIQIVTHLLAIVSPTFLLPHPGQNLLPYAFTIILHFALWMTQTSMQHTLTLGAPLWIVITFLALKGMSEGKRKKKGHRGLLGKLFMPFRLPSDRLSSAKLYPPPYIV